MTVQRAKIKKFAFAFLNEDLIYLELIRKEFHVRIKVEANV